jgi:DNA repair photolyase
MKRCATAGYPVRAVVMPVIPVPDWQAVYEWFLKLLLADETTPATTRG